MFKVILLLIWAINLVMVPSALSFGRSKPVYNPTVQIPQALTPADVEAVIQAALARRRWKVQEQTSGFIQTEIKVRSHQAQLQLIYDETNIRFQYVSSKNLLHAEKSGTTYIHRNYNKWVQTLAQDLTKRLKVAQGSRAPAVVNAPTVPSVPSVSQPRYSLTIYPTPVDSTIKILNIRPRYQAGISLAPGRYLVRVEREGFVTKDTWITISTADMTREIALDVSQKDMVRAEATPPPSSGSAYPKQAEEDDVPPELTITSHNIRQAVAVSPTTSRVRVAGRSTDESGVAEILVNGKITPFDSTGRFASEVLLKIGDNPVVITATDVHHNVSEQTLTIHRAAAMIAAPPQRPGLGRYHALVIGNNAYKYIPPLKTAVHDATQVAETLKRDYGFDVTLLTNASRDEVLSSFDRLRATLTESDNLLIYYAGHGHLDTVTERGYWLPVDARRGAQANWIANTTISDTLKAIQAKHVMVVADSCYAGALVRAVSVVALPTGADRAKHLAALAKKRARTALVSGGLEPVVDSGGGQHSVFAKTFLQVLKENQDTIEGERVFAKIQRPVMLEADQTPQYSDIRFTGHEGGDFLFVRRKGP